MPTLLKMRYTAFLLQMALLMAVADDFLRVQLYWLQSVNTRQVSGRSLAKRWANQQRSVDVAC